MAGATAIMGASQSAPATLERPGAWHGEEPSMQHERTSPSGLCECGCGQRTPVSTKTDRAVGHVKGAHRRFVKGHHKRKSGTDFIVDPASGCWVWQRHCDALGYGKLDARSSATGHTFAHRMIYERELGPIPAGASLDHLCRNTSCVNPAHLEPVTHAENCRRGLQAKLTTEDAALIREIYARGDTSQRALAARFNVRQSTIGRLLAGDTWGIGGQ